MGILAIHSYFLREHNRIALRLGNLNPRWLSDRIFQETRKIVGAELQVITYEEFLPTLMGPENFERWIGTYSGYDETVDPTVSEAFTSAAFRMGHGLIQEFYPRLDADFRQSFEGPLRIDNAILRPLDILGFQVDNLMRGMMTQAVKSPEQIHPSITERLFGNHDLSAINIQRGRDVGLPPFNDWRKFCQLPEIEKFEDLMTDDSRRAKDMNELYGNDTGKLDLYVGGTLEKSGNNGSMLGDTYACLIGDQFKRLRDGDRFFYSNPGVFTPEQLASLQNVTLSRIFCDNGETFHRVPKNSFIKFDIPSTESDPITEIFDEDKLLVFCEDMPSLDLTLWRES